MMACNCAVYSLVLRQCYGSAAACCAPRDNEPLPQELADCPTVVHVCCRELQFMRQLRVPLGLGSSHCCIMNPLTPRQIEGKIMQRQQ